MPQHSRSSEYCQLLVIRVKYENYQRYLSSRVRRISQRDGSLWVEMFEWLINYREGIIVACFKSSRYNKIAQISDDQSVLHLFKMSVRLSPTLGKGLSSWNKSRNLELLSCLLTIGPLRPDEYSRYLSMWKSSFGLNNLPVRCFLLGGVVRNDYR